MKAEALPLVFTSINNSDENADAVENSDILTCGLPRRNIKNLPDLAFQTAN